jgi:uncharacterized protein (TIGR03437 family)
LLVAAATLPLSAFAVGDCVAPTQRCVRLAHAGWFLELNGFILKTLFNRARGTEVALYSGGTATRVFMGFMLAALILALSLATSAYAQTQRASPPATIPEEVAGAALEQKRALVFQSSTPGGSIAKGANAWTLLGPAGANGSEGIESGHVSAILTDSRNPEWILIAAGGGGIWRSKDGGAGWQPLADNLPSLASSALALDERTGALYYGTGDQCCDSYGAGIFRSPDGGVTWINSNGWDQDRNKPQFVGGITPRILVHPLDSRTLFAARNSGLWFSGDGGERWARLVPGFISDAAIDSSNPSRIYAAVGATLGDASNGLYRSNNGGMNWERVPGLPFGSGIGRMSIALAPSNPLVIYAALVRSSDQQLSGVYRSSDGGNSWTRLPAPAALFDSAGQGQGYFDNYVAVDPRDPNVVYLGGVELWKSTDGGAAWRVLSLTADGRTRIIHEDQFSIAFKPGNPDTVYVGNEGGIYRSPDGGNSWQSLNTGLPITQFNFVAVHPQNPLIVLGGTQGQGLVRFNGSSIWAELIRGDAGQIVFDPSDPDVVYVAKQRFRLMRSGPGDVFTQVSAGINSADRVSFYPPITVQPGNTPVLYFGTYRLWASSNRGDTWTAVSGDLTNGGTLTAIAVSPDGSIYSGSSDGRISVSNGSGSSRSGGGLPNRTVTSIAVDPRLPGTAYLTVWGFGTGHVFRTADAGYTWTEINGNLPDAPANAVVVDPSGPIYVATDMGVFRSDDGASWSSFNVGLPSSIVTSLALDARSQTLTACTYGRGVYQISLQAAQAGPDLLAQGVVNAANFQAAVAPGAIVSLFGTRLAVSQASAPGLPLPTTLAGTSITVNGQPAPLFFVSPTQINFQFPFEVTGAQALVEVTTLDGATTLVVLVVPVAPAIINGSIIHAATGALVNADNPAVAGEVLTLFVAGLGATSPAVPSGVPAPSAPFAVTVAQVTVVMRDWSANVVFSGLAPGSVGLYQVSFVVPEGASGNVLLTVSAAGRVSSPVLVPTR